MAVDPLLSPDVAQRLKSFVEQLKNDLGDDLLSVVLYGSAAENRLRHVSDINMLIVLKRFDLARVKQLSQVYPSIRVELHLRLTIALASELQDAAETFALKYLDIKTRHQVLYGDDLIDPISISDTALRLGVLQSLLNIKMRLRERYLANGKKEDLLWRSIAEVAGPLRAACLAITYLQGKRYSSPRESLLRFAEEVGDIEFTRLVEVVSEVREGKIAETLDAAKIFSILLDFINTMRKALKN